MMKNFTFPLKIILFICLILWFLTPYNQAQSVKRQCISSYGAVIITNDAAFMQTVGQSYNTTASVGNSSSVLQGFQQPVVFRVEMEDPLLSNGLDLDVYPNPATYAVTIQSGKPIENSLISVVDLNGKFIMSEQLAQLHTYTINCGEWKNGIYIITVHDKDQNKSSLKVTISK